jgi:hypothetical protein
MAYRTHSPLFLMNASFTAVVLAGTRQHYAIDRCLSAEPSMNRPLDASEVCSAEPLP